MSSTRPTNHKSPRPRTHFLRGGAHAEWTSVTEYEAGDDTAGGRLDYGYTANNLLEDLVSSNSDGVNIGYHYDDANRLAYVDDASTGVPAATTSYTYNLNGSLETVTTPNAVTHTYHYDTLNRLRTLDVTSATEVIHSYVYALRASGHRSGYTESATRSSLLSIRRTLPPHRRNGSRSR